ncbi:hypothetical protein CANINC_004612 [Pichia inconspicua]|uniref:Protein FMP42 n=1 Tax=Pichia inconspicua TaxID=52247 RepID=A0A4T0WVR6_9ASCO|nr:hypothetical protein CANINC_004612 [[Candida] inconspicua]
MSTEQTPLITPLQRRDNGLPSSTLRYIQITCAVLWCLFAAGPVFGFAALKPLLISQGVYENVCDVKTPSYSITDSLCVEQDLALNRMFTWAAVITNVTSILVGYILDNYGPRITGILGSIFLAMASYILSNSGEITKFDAYLVGYVSLAFAGPFVFISSFQLANSFPKNSGFVLALLTGAFDSSSALFLAYRIIYENHYIENLTIKRFFKYYLAVPAFILFCQIFIMPHESYTTIESVAKVAETGLDEDGLPLDPHDTRYNSEEVEAVTRSRARQTSVVSTKSVFEEIADHRLKEKTGGVFGVLHNKSVKEQLVSPWWYLILFFTVIQMIRINYFVATIASQMEYYFDSGTAVKINKFFDIALPLGGLVSIPFIGLILDNLHTLVVLTIMLVASLTIGIFGMLSIQLLQYCGILLLVVYRPFYYTSVSDYCVKVFGYSNFGTVYGAIICISGIINSTQALLDTATHYLFSSNPNPINFILVTITLVSGGLLLAFVKSQEKEAVKQSIIEEVLEGCEDEPIYNPPQ